VADQIQSAFVTIQGRSIAYDHRPGEGETVLLLHGITTYRFIWRKIIPRLSPEYNVFAVDLLGCGDSDKSLDEDYSIPAHAERLARFCSELNLGKIHLVGHDIGGGIAQVMATQQRVPIHSLSLLNSVGFDLWPVQPIKTLRIPVLRQLAMATLDLGMLRMIIHRGLFDPSKLTDELLDLFSHPLRDRGGRKAFLKFAASLNNQNLMDIEDQLNGLSLPTLILRGANDVYLSETISKRLHLTIPESRLIILEAAGHFFQEDQPELIATYLQDLFRF